MSENLKKITEEWKKLERKTFEQRKLADEFYDNHLMQLIRDDYIKRNKKKVFEKVKYLVVSVGTSYEPIVLNISLFQPEKILFLCTEQTEKYLDKIISFCKLGASGFDKSLVSETDPLTIYREIKKVYLAWNKPEKMYIDFTGGTKAMSAASAMAGAMIDVQLVYVGSNNYLTDFRKPDPGSETLFYIDNPLAVFGDLEIEKAFLLFSKQNFAGARSQLEQLKENVPDPSIRQQLNFAYLLAYAYEFWDALDFVPAYDAMVRLNKELKRDLRHDRFILMDKLDEIKMQLTVLSSLKEIPQMIKERKNADILKEPELIHSLMFTMYQNAVTREKQEKYDMATLLFYRLLEMIEQRRLALYNLYVSDMNYTAINYTQDYNVKYRDADCSHRFSMLKNDVSEIKKIIFKKPGNGYLPDQVSLLEGFIILYAFHDPVLFHSEKEGMNMLKRIRAMVYLRNNSIFAHGLGPVDKTDYLKFRSFVEEVFIEFCRVEDISFYKTGSMMQWIDPKDSENYVKTLGIRPCQ